MLITTNSPRGNPPKADGVVEPLAVELKPRLDRGAAPLVDAALSGVVPIAVIATAFAHLEPLELGFVKHHARAGGLGG